MYVDPDIGKFKSVRRKVCEYFSMALDYTTRGEVKMDMRKYVKNMIDKYPVNIDKSQAVTRPSTDNVFKVDGSKPLNKSKAGLFHRTFDPTLLHSFCMLCLKLSTCIFLLYA